MGDLGGVKGDFSLDKIGKKKGFEFWRENSKPKKEVLMQKNKDIQLKIIALRKS